jgi:hypothetical protein
LGKPENCREIDPPLRTLQGDHQAACHYAEEALKTDVGVAHVSDKPVRRGTPEAALKVAHKALAEGLDVPLTEGAAELPPKISEEAADTPGSPMPPTEGNGQN